MLTTKLMHVIEGWDDEIIIISMICRNSQNGKFTGSL